ncbi:hypothetical protein RDI58_022897 [Solanum bulbocastanum]|uniref:Uncharacterized protein n=1 Tax=Solanum bulbocastanum TaxID=147425 RepID=A0AAN8TA72_SOLBU
MSQILPHHLCQCPWRSLMP